MPYDPGRGYRLGRFLTVPPGSGICSTAASMPFVGVMSMCMQLACWWLGTGGLDRRVFRVEQG